MKPSDLHLLRQKLPISASTAKRNPTATSNAHREPPVAVAERSASAPLEQAGEDKAGGTAKCLIRIESRRVHLQDPDNGMEKWHIDALRYAGLIPNDTTAEIKIDKWQTKVFSRSDECTVITLAELPDVTPTEAAEFYAKTLNELKI